MSRNGSKPPRSKMTEAQERRIRASLEKVFRQLQQAGPASKDPRTYDFVFHMTDWYCDLVALARVMQHPEGKDEDEWFDAVFGFLLHTSGHLLAAAKLAEIEPVEFEMPTAKQRTRKAHVAAR